MCRTCSTSVASKAALHPSTKSPVNLSFAKMPTLWPCASTTNEWNKLSSAHSTHNTTTCQETDIPTCFKSCTYNIDAPFVCILLYWWDSTVEDITSLSHKLTIQSEEYNMCSTLCRGTCKNAMCRQALSNGITHTWDLCQNVLLPTFVH